MNSDIIRLLPDSVANQIAAGEVIQRPASVIKELVENAVDAGATEISIILKDAGRTLIQVVDNGSGMSPTDARMAFERHATSKISSAADLFTLHTMGFRGEALPSISAVAQIDMRTMRREDSMGSRLTISEGKFEGQEPASCIPGTNIMVKNIFFHMPARRKFLKKDSVELNHILREFERLALVNTNIDFTLIHNDTTLHKFMHGNLKQRIADLFGKNLESQLAHISTETGIVKIDGFIAMPRAAKKRGYQQFLFVNGRNMRHPLFHKAVLSCYEQLIAPDSQPSYFINFEVDPATIDVNIHPQKHEIKFEHEQAIWQILVAAIRETLGKTQAVGALDFDAIDAPEIPLFNPENEIERPDDGADISYNPFETNDFSAPTAIGMSDSFASHSANAWGSRNVSLGSGSSKRQSVPDDWEKLYDSFNQQRDDAYASVSIPDDPSLADDTVIAAPTDQPSSCVQLQGKYIVMPYANGLMIISQHRAHIRILFERYMNMMSDNDKSLASQKLMFADDFEVSPAQNALLLANKDHFTTLGFELSENEDLKWSILAVPSLLNGANPIEAIMAVLDRLEQDGDADPATFKAPLALAMARSGAVKQHQVLSQAEMETISADLFRCNEPNYTPDGLSVMTLISNDEISSRFEI